MKNRDPKHPVRRTVGMRAVSLPVLALALVSSLAACGSDDDGSSAPTIVDPPLTTVAPATTDAPTTTAAPIAASELDVGLADYSFAGLPAEIPSGVTRIVGTNTGKEEHQAAFFRIEDGHTFDEVLGALAGDPKSGYPLVHFAGGAQSVAPGDGQSAVVDLAPGDYVVACLIPGSDGVPHAAKGMLQQVTVSDSGAAATPPVPAGDSIVLTNYAFGLPDTVPTTGTIRVVNNGDQPHEVAAYRVNDGVDPQTALTALTSLTPSGPPPVTPAGGVTPINPGEVAGIDVDWAPGDYVLVCFLPDAVDGAPHFTKGMATKFTVPA